MTDIEKIRAEIERLQEIHERNLKKPMERGRIGYAHGVVACCDRILDFIDSLPEEPDQGLDVTDFCKPIDPGIAKCVADHWWKMMEEEPDKSLEDAAERQINEALFKWSYDDEDGIEQYVHDAFIAGAEWRYQKDRAEFAKLKAKEWSDGYNEGITKGKEQIMKEAVEGEVVKTFPEGVTSIHYLAPAGIGEMAYFCSDNGLNIGDKVRIIIVKEDK